VGEGAQQAPQGESPAPESGEAVAGETPASEAPPAEGQTLPVDLPPAEPESPPVATQPAETQEENTPAPPAGGAEDTTHKSGAGEGSEEGAAGGSSASRSTSTSTTVTAATTEDTATHLLLPAAQEPPSGTPGPPATIAAQAAELQASEAQGAGSKRGAVATASKQAGQFGCELAALSGSMTDNCTVGWLGASRDLTSVLQTSPAIAAVSSLKLAGGPGNGPTGGGNSGFVVSGPPMTPAPGPAPSGASGAATGGGSGAGVSIFLTLAGLLLLGAPRAMRRLRLSCEPWLAGCFVLIPERPD